MTWWKASSTTDKLDAISSVRTYVNLARADQVHHNSSLVKSTENPSQEPMTDRLPVRMDVDDDDLVLDGDRRRHLDRVDDLDDLVDVSVPHSRG